MHLPPVPEPRDLLPPLLACLPTTFVSPRAPPALLPLLAPILRQRVNYLSSNNTNNRDGWIRLLCWDAQQASKLPSKVENLELEPHPVSGEVEIDDVRVISYKRFDDETLHSRLEADQFELLITYVWCENDEHGGTGPGWKLTELKSQEDAEDSTTWYESISEANDAYNTHTIAVPQPTESVPTPHLQPQVNQEDDDADYWAAYDRTPSQTPAQKASPAPSNVINRVAAARGPSSSELEYFARYGTEVQPALDAHDPNEENPELGESTLNGTQQRIRTPAQDTQQDGGDEEVVDVVPEQEDNRPAWQKALYPHQANNIAHDSAIATLSQSRHSDLNMPRPISPASSHGSVEKLEEQAAAMSDDSSRFEIGIRQHISTDIKSLFRLARSVGMDRREFERVVKRELEVLAMIDDE